MQQPLPAQESAQQVAGALERGELIRIGLESYRREDFAKAQDAFEKLEAKVKSASACRAGPQNFTPEQSKQFARDYGWTMSRLGDTYHKLREFDKAIEHYESGRVILERVLKDEPAANLFETYHGLAHAYHDNAKFRSVAVYAGPTTMALTPDQQLSKAEDYYKKAASYQEANLITTNNPLAAVSQSQKSGSALYGHRQVRRCGVEFEAMWSKAIRRASSQRVTAHRRS